MVALISSGRILETRRWSLVKHNPKWTGHSLLQAKPKRFQTFSKFKDYLKTASLPTDLAETSKPLWREAKQRISDGYGSRYVYATPKSFSASQEDSIRNQTGITDFDFITHDMLLERGREFLDGQTGMLSFELKFDREILNIPQDFGSLEEY